MSTANKVDNNKTQEEIVSGFLGGLNSFQDETLIKDSELSEAKNILLSVDGIQPRYGTLNFGDDDGSSKVLGGIGYYNSDGTREFLRVSGGYLKKYVGSTPTQIGTTAYSSTARAEMVQARDKVYIFNNTNNHSYYDGSTITVYSTVNTPVGLSVTPAGTTGSTSYSYMITAFNAVGETLATAAVAISNGNAVLSATNYNDLSWTVTAGATGYNVYGRTADGLGEVYLASVYTNAYADKGQDSPQATVLPPEANTTQGIKGTMAVFGLSRIFVAGDPDYPSRLYYSGLGVNVGNFSRSTDPSADSSVGGDYVDVFANDGYRITSILPFQGGIIVWKENAIYKFSFTTLIIGDTTVSAPQLEEITRSFGGISFRSTKHVENDIIFLARKDGRAAFYSLGNQENYAGSVLRTNELSIKIQEKLEDVNLEEIGNSAAFYFQNIYGCAIPTSKSSVNNRVWCLDTRFGAWDYWEGFNPAFFMTYIDTSGVEKLYYGTDDDGYMVEAFYPQKSDNGTPISVQWSTKAFNQKQFQHYKRYDNPIFQFKNVSKSGGIGGEIYVDGAILKGGFTINQQTPGGAGVGFGLVGVSLPGDAKGATNTGVGLSADIVVEVKKITRGRSIKYNFTSSVANLDYKFLSLAHKYSVLGQKALPQQSVTYAQS